LGKIVNRVLGSIIPLPFWRSIVVFTLVSCLKNLSMPDYKTYLSPFTWRYGSPEMRSIWSEVNKRGLWRRIWLTLAQVQSEYGLIKPEQLDELRARVNDVDVERSLEIESQIHHDLMAELKAYAETCPLAGGGLHLGATSMDIEDNADVLRMRQSLDLILEKLGLLLAVLADKIVDWADLPIIAFTHLQPAEPSTLGYRLSQYAQDLLEDHRWIAAVRSGLRGKGFKGAVGTGASYGELVGNENLSDFEARLSAQLDLPFYPIATQTYPRKQDYQVISALASMGGALYKFAFDLRILQSPVIGEIAEPFGTKQVGSSAMPFKRNPINAEKLDSLARALAQYPRLAWDNAAHSLLERTLDDSANRRTMLPETFLISDELLSTAIKIINGLRVNEESISRNLKTYGPFAALERVLMALGKAGADRQIMHERLREHAMEAWKAVQHGLENPMTERLVADPDILQYLDLDHLKELMEVGQYLGDAAQRAHQLATTINSYLKEKS
jgi:adenylosuccinate lyase